MRRNDRAAGHRGLENAVVGVARREPADVPRALRAVHRLRLPDHERRATALVDLAFDVDGATIGAFLAEIGRIPDESWRARTLFTCFQQAKTTLTRSLPEPAQDAVVELVRGLADPQARSAALRQLPADLPESLRARLRAIADALPEPVTRLRTLLAYETSPSAGRSRVLLHEAAEIDDEEQRALALETLAPVLGPRLLAKALAIAGAMRAHGAAGRAMAALAGRLPEGDERRDAQKAVFDRSRAIEDPLRRFDVLYALHDLPPPERTEADLQLFEIATRVPDAETRCRALFMAGDATQDEMLRARAFLSGIAAAETVAPPARGALLGALRPVGPWLDPAVRAAVRRAVERYPEPETRDELRQLLGRVFVRDRPADAGTGPPIVARWDLFVSYATADLDAARHLAFDLRSRGLRVFLSDDDIDTLVGSAGWLAAIDHAIEGSRSLLVLVTEAALASKWVRDEWTKFYRTMVDREHGTLISFRLGGPAIAQLPLTLRHHQVIDSASGFVEPGHLTRILDLVR